MKLERLEATPLTSLLNDILVEQRSGMLAVIHGAARRTIYWAAGELALTSSTVDSEKFGQFALARNAVTPQQARLLDEAAADELAGMIESNDWIDTRLQQQLLRGWASSIFVPLFSVQEGTVAFEEDSALDPAQRLFIPSTPALILDGIRSISNGLLIRRSLGDMKRRIAPFGPSHVTVENAPLLAGERQIAESLTEPQPIEAFLKRFPSDSLTAARVVIALLTTGAFSIVENQKTPSGFSDTEKDLLLLASIGSNDPRSLQIVRYVRELPTLDYYALLHVPRAATRAQILARAEELRQQYDPVTYPAPVRDHVETIARKVEEAVTVLKDPLQRPQYDRLLLRGVTHQETYPMDQLLTRRSIAEQNFRKAQELSYMEEFYPAIVLLRESIRLAPDHAAAWRLLGGCQERNPKWRRQAIESYQKALSVDPNSVDTLLALGDIYRREALASRAQACYEDALRIEPENAEVKSRLKRLKEKM